jgi:hypothetical protein
MADGRAGAAVGVAAAAVGDPDQGAPDWPGGVDGGEVDPELAAVDRERADDRQAVDAG